MRFLAPLEMTNRDLFRGSLTRSGVASLNQAVEDGSAFVTPVSYLFSLSSNVRYRTDEKTANKLILTH